MTEFKFGNFKAQFDALDLEFQQKVEKLSEEADAKIKDLQKNIKNIKMSEYIIGYCGVIFDFFEKMFDDENAANKMFGKKTSIEVCDAAFIAFIEAKNKAYTDYQNKIGNVIKLNRAQRRNKK